MPSEYYRDSRDHRDSYNYSSRDRPRYEDDRDRYYDRDRDSRRHRDDYYDGDYHHRDSRHYERSHRSSPPRRNYDRERDRSRDRYRREPLPPPQKRRRTRSRSASPRGRRSNSKSRPPPPPPIKTELDDESLRIRPPQPSSATRIGIPTPDKRSPVHTHEPESKGKERARTPTGPAAERRENQEASSSSTTTFRPRSPPARLRTPAQDSAPIIPRGPKSHLPSTLKTPLSAQSPRNTSSFQSPIDARVASPVVGVEPSPRRSTILPEHKPRTEIVITPRPREGTLWDRLKKGEEQIAKFRADRRQMEVEHLKIARGVRRAMYDVDLAHIDFKAAQVRRIDVEAEFEKTKQTVIVE